MEEFEMILEVDGERIPMNEFVRKVLYGMITGSIQTLRGVENDWKTINISLKR